MTEAVTVRKEPRTHHSPTFLEAVGISNGFANQRPRKNRCSQESKSMVTLNSRPLVQPSYAYGIIALFLFGFYLGWLFGVGTLAAFIVARRFFRGRFRWLMSLGGGFSGLATWITVLMNHREKYDRVIAFLAEHLGKNGAFLLTDSVICTVGALFFVGSLGYTRRTTGRAFKMMMGGLRGSSKKTERAEDEEPEVGPSAQ